MESFSGASIGTESSVEYVNPMDEEELRDTVKKAISKADAILDKKETKNDIRALYAKGAAKGTLAAFEAVVKKKYKAALDNASAAKELHQKVLDKDPAFTDAKLSIGIYKYAVGAIPGWVRLFLLLWSGGDKAGGIADVKTVADGTGAAATDAKMLLVVLYNREGQFEKSYETLTALHNRYPRAYLLEMSGAAVQARLNHYDKAIAIYRGVMEKIDARRDGYERLEAPKVLLLMARAELERPNVAEARKIWERVIVEKRATDTDRANARLWLGKTYDAEKQREKALAEYDAILKPELKAAPRLKEEAAKYKKNAFGA
jgi:tetratricopeptide (TPR) repeat protein